MNRFLFLWITLSIHAFGANGQTPKGFGFTFFCNGKDSVRVDKVISESPAAKSGLLPGDLLQKINGVSLLHKPQADVSKQLADAPDQSSFTFLRSGKPKQLVVTKAPAYTFNRICLTGDCINGKGLAIGKLSSNMLEGTFVNGELMDGSWYINGTDVNNKGRLIRRGKIATYGERFSGFFIDPNLKNGERWYEVSNHDFTKYQFAGGTQFNGHVKCYADPDGKKILWKGSFSDGSPVNIFTQYDHEKDLEWSYLLRNGNKLLHTLLQLSTGKMLGDNLNYDERTHSWSGLFTVGTSRVVYLSNMTSYQQIAEQYRYAVQSTPPSTPTNSGSSKPSYSSGAIVSEAEATAARIRMYERIKTIDGAMEPDIRSCKKDAAYGINVMRMSGACSRVYKYCNEIVTLCNDYLAKYESATPYNHIQDIKARRDDANRVKSEVNR
ncbi:MAG: PDZ domain-containing protein [Lacibacter sp.]